MDQAVDLVYILKSIGLTIFFVGLIGFERQRRNKIAGLTTHLLVALGAAGLTMVQQYMVYDTIQFLKEYPEYIGTVNIERQRIVAQIVSGIGFLGTGAIIKTNGYISGLTTASTLWIGAIIGIIFGYGYFWLGITLSLSILFVLTIIKNFFRHVVEDPHH
ncbi:MAG: MgtC/SapB family protein [Candidatus Izemoplasmataceae bacterium]|jgi:putative Mg2+ transporter-C (MgtC) family protein|uniref:MgtC/SapB family protein n=1 Tax=Liberiplasma polymorphum TaxID=3374570 RepID=UPI0037742A6E